jgi:hypothetical protein
MTDGNQMKNLQTFEEFVNENFVNEASGAFNAKELEKWKLKFKPGVGSSLVSVDSQYTLESALKISDNPELTKLLNNVCDIIHAASDEIYIINNDNCNDDRKLSDMFKLLEKKFKVTFGYNQYLSSDQKGAIDEKLNVLRIEESGLTTYFVPTRYYNDL